MHIHTHNEIQFVVVITAAIIFGNKRGNFLEVLWAAMKHYGGLLSLKWQNVVYMLEFICLKM